MWVVLSLQAASIGQIPVILCCLGLLLTPLLVTCGGPGRLASFSNLAVSFLRRVLEGSPSLLVVLICDALFGNKVVSWELGVRKLS